MIMTLSRLTRDRFDTLAEIDTTERVDTNGSDYATNYTRSRADVPPIIMFFCVSHNGNTKK